MGAGCIRAGYRLTSASPYYWSEMEQYYTGVFEVVTMPQADDSLSSVGSPKILPSLFSTIIQYYTRS
jgi:hypothetical protein